MQMVPHRDRPLARGEEEARAALGVFSALRRQWKFALTLFGVSAFLVTSLVLLVPRRYEAEMKILIDNDRATELVAAGAVTPTTPPNINDTEINSEIQLMTSSGLLDKVARDVDASEHPKAPKPTPIDFERAVKKMQRHLSVEAARRSAVIEVSYTDKSPERAGLVLRNLLAAYLVAHTAAHANPGTFQFFTDQVESHQKQLEQVEQQLTKYELEEGASDLPQQQQLLLREREETQAAIFGSAAAARSQATSISQGQATLRTTDARIPTDARSTPNQYSMERMNTLLVELKSKRAALLANFPPTDRQVKDIDKQIAVVQQGFQSAVQDESMERATGVNPLYQALLTDLNRQQMDLAAERARHAALQADLLAYDGRLARLAFAEQEYGRLHRLKNQLEDDVLLYSKKQEEARVAQELDRQRFSNVTVIEPPMPFYTPTQPKILLDLILGYSLAFCLALIASVMKDQIYDGVHGTEELRELTGLPVLGITHGGASW